MKKVIGLDIGTTSIGWAYVNEAESPNEKSSIVKLGVRVIPLTTDEETDFQKGKSISINAERTLKRSARKNLNRYQLRRNALIKCLKKNNFIIDSTLLSEDGKGTTFLTYKLRAKSARQKISKEDLAKVFIMINKKRGYKSNRKTRVDEEGSAINGMEVAKYMSDNKLTPGQYVYEILRKGKRYIPDFYRSDLTNEQNHIWEFQKQYYPNILVDELKENIEGKNKGQTWKICEKPFNIVGIKQTGTKDEKRLELYKWRTKSLTEKIDLEILAIILSEINNQINSSSGYLGAISDRSKKLYFNKQTVGEYLYNQLKNNKHARLKNQIFYRQDYLDEFETIWETQKKYYSELTDELKQEIRDIIIFYQRPLKSQKGLLSHCEFESWEKEYIDTETGKKKTKIIGHRVIPKSSPLFQEFKIWQILNNIQLLNKTTGEIGTLGQESKQLAFSRLNIESKLSAKDFLKIIVDNPSEYEINYKEVEGNRTIAELYKVFNKILELEGKEHNFSKMGVDEIIKTIRDKFIELGISTDILEFDSEKTGNDFDKQPIMQLWHLLYSAQEEEKLIKKLSENFGFKKEHSKLLAKIPLQDNYGSLSTRAIRKILPHLKEGNTYDVACILAGYNHSSSLTKEDREKRELKNHLELLPKNSLRNPVVVKILNQMVNVVNAIIDDESLGKPDEIRIELARELKKSADERKQLTDSLNKSTTEHEKIRKILQKDFGITKVTRNDIIRYKLWKELESYGYKTIYTDTYIPKEELFSNKFDIEHIIPQARLFDDSFSNKTLSLRQINIEKGNKTAYDYLKEKLNEEEFNQYVARIEKLYSENKISKAKYNKLKMKGTNIPDGFIERDLRDSQYIAKKAKEMLEEVVRTVNTTTGSITNHLRSDWQLVNVMKELNLSKYETLGLVEFINGKNGTPEKQIRDWTKRNDHRHHAVDALIVAFTSYAHVQYLNYMNARNNKRHSKYHEVYGIEQKYLYKDEQNKRLFKPPMPIAEFRQEAKKHLENILISFKAKNKVVTRNKNKIRIKGKNNFKEKIELTPRGQLHKETIYGKIKTYKIKEEKIGITFDYEKIQMLANEKYKNALVRRLNEFNGNSRKAFGGKNSPAKNPIFVDEEKVVSVPEKIKLVWFEDNFTIRKKISPDIKVEKIIDTGIKRILQKRLDDFDGDSKIAFSNSDENPIWLNKEKGIAIKRVTISGVSNVQALHYKKDHNGNFILDVNGEKQPVDFVSTGNNHHVAIYRDEDGNLQDEVVSFYEAVHRVNAGLPIINKNKNGLTFLYTMKQNECFIFPSDDFDPNEIDIVDPGNASIISPNLFRVQKLSRVEYGNSVVRDYVFRHHLETLLIDKKETRDITYKVFKSLNNLHGIVKVRINHLGQIVKVGEY